MFAIDFTKPWLYKDVIYFNQGNLATNNVLRCKLITGGYETLDGFIATVTFKTLSNAEINDFATIVDAKNCIIDIKFPSNALDVGINELEVILSKGEGIDKVVTPSPTIKYEVWQCLTTGNGIQGDTNYPILIDLIDSVNAVYNKANATLDKVNDMKSNLEEVINNANIATSNAQASANNANSKIEEVENAKTNMIERVDTSIEVMRSNVENFKSDIKATTDNKIQEVDRALAAGTQDLEVKAAREDMDGVVRDTLKERLENDLKIGSKSLKQEVLDLAGLKESQDMAYSTDKGYLVCKETKVGTVKDLKVKGRSLVNICGKRNFSIEGKESSLTNDLGKLTQPIPHGQEFTVILKVPKNLPNSKCFFKAYDKNGSGRADIFDGTELYNNRGSILVKNVTPTSTFDTDIVNVRLFASNTAGTFGVEDVIILIGDHSQNQPKEYFEGLASVGTGVDKIEVLTRKEDGNLFSPENIITDSINLYGYSKIQNNNKPICLTIIDKDVSVNIDGIYLGLTYKGINADNGLAWCVGNGSIFHSSINRSYNYLSFFPNNKETIEKLCKRFDIVVNKGTSPMPYQPYKSDKKPLLFKDDDGTWKPIKELRGLETVCDTVELHSDGKYYYHIRTEKSVLNGTEGWINPSWLENDTLAFSLPLSVKPYGNFAICDKFNVISNGLSTQTAECCQIVSNTSVAIRILKSKLKTQDIEGFKKWLQANNVTIIHQLAEEKVFEVNPLFLEAFEGETSVFVNSGVVNAPIEFKIASYITNLVLLNQQRISLIEQEMFNMFKQVLSGDMYSLAEKLYPEDFIEEKYIATPIPEL